jgi:AraC-like DNA-binding protein
MDTLYLQLLPLPRHRTFVRQLFLFRDRGSFPDASMGRFASSCREIGLTCEEGAARTWRFYDRPPRFGSAARRRPFRGWALGLHCDPRHVTPSFDPTPALECLRSKVAAEVESDPVSLERLVHALDDCVNGFMASEGFRAGALRARSGVSLRTIQRRMKSTVGLSPKRWDSLGRFERALLRIASGGEPLSDIALDSGYADQAHMTTELSRHAGCSPSRLRALARLMGSPAGGIRLRDPALAARVQLTMAK